MITGASKAIKHHHPNAIIIRIDPVSVDGVSRVEDAQTTKSLSNIPWIGLRKAAY